MADRYLLESSATDGYLLEDGTGVLLLETPASEVFFENRHPIEEGMKPQTAAGMGGVLIE
jgi:hypothetical protein